MNAIPMDVVNDQEKKKQRHQLFMAQAKEIFGSYDERLRDQRWKSVPYTRDPQISCYELDGTAEKDGYNLKAECIIEGKTADMIADAHRNYQAVPRRTWDKDDIYDIGLLEAIRSQDVDSETRVELNVQYAEHKPSVPGVAMREFVYLEWSMREASYVNQDDHKWTILTRETDHPSRPVKADPVRALSRTIMVLTPLKPKRDDGLNIPWTSVTLVAWVKPGGWIPDSVVQLYKTKLADRLAFLKKTMFV